MINSRWHLSMCQTLCYPLNQWLHLILTITLLSSLNVSILLRFGEIGYLIQGHIVWTWFGQNLTQGCLIPDVWWSNEWVNFHLQNLYLFHHFSWKEKDFWFYRHLCEKEQLHIPIRLVLLCFKDVPVFNVQLCVNYRSHWFLVIPQF